MSAATSDPSAVTGGAILAFAPEDRAILRVEGADAETFLQGLLTNDVARASAEAPVYAALLSPQGKFLADALVWRLNEAAFLLDADAAFAPDLIKRLSLYKLRAAVTIAQATELGALLLWSNTPEASLSAAETGASLAETAARLAERAPALATGPDPRQAGLGWRLIGERAALAAAAAALAPGEPDALRAAYARRRIALGVPAAGLDLRPNDGFVLEYGFERLSGVDFKKGCFVGQEIVARMKHKSTLKKGLFRLAYDGPDPEAGAEIRTADGKPAGVLGSAQGGAALGLLRYDRANGALTIGERALPVLSAEPVEPPAPDA